MTTKSKRQVIGALATHTLLNQLTPLLVKLPPPLDAYGDWVEGWSEERAAAELQPGVEHAKAISRIGAWRRALVGNYPPSWRVRKPSQGPQLDRKVEELETTIRELDHEVDALEMQAVDLGRQIDQLEAEAARLEADVARLEAEVAEFKPDAMRLRQALERGMNPAPQRTPDPFILTAKAS